MPLTVAGVAIGGWSADGGGVDTASCASKRASLVLAAAGVETSVSKFDCEKDVLLRSSIAEESCGLGPGFCGLDSGVDASIVAESAATGSENIERDRLAIKWSVSETSLSFR